MADTAQQIESSEELAERCQDGDTRAYAALLEQFGPRIFGFLHNRIGNVHDAEDLTQEVFVKAYRNIHRFDTSRPFGPWLFTIARRTAATFHRRRRPVEILDENAVSDEADPQSRAESEDDCRRIWAFARTLRPRYFEVLWLRYREDFQLPQIAESIGTTVLNTKVLLHRARAELARKLEAARFYHSSP